MKAELDDGAAGDSGPLGAINRAITLFGGAALVIASAVLSWSVVVRYFLRLPTPWQDEAAIFLIVGTIFLSAASVQAQRGHVGIEVLGSILPPGIDRWRRVLVDVASLAFCAFFAWKSWTLWHEAWIDDYRTSSTWGPPLWIPYGLMATGMSLLPLQILLQIVDGARGRSAP